MLDIQADLAENCHPMASDDPPVTLAKCAACGEPFAVPPEGPVVSCPHCRQPVARDQLDWLPRLPAAEPLPSCPVCQAEALLGRADGGVECASCGTVLSLGAPADPRPAGTPSPARAPEPGEAGRKRNYTPDRGISGFMPTAGEGAVPASHAGPGTVLPSRHSPEAAAPSATHHGVQPLRVPPMATRDHEGLSHVLEVQRQRKWLAKGAFLFGVLLCVGVGWWVFRLQKGEGVPVIPSGATTALSLPAGLPSESSAALPTSDILRARQFVVDRVAKATQWEDLLPMVRKRGEVEPLMRSYYRANPFRPWTGRRILQERPKANSSGSFVVFLMEDTTSEAASVVVVETGGDTCALDWEMSVNYPLFEWDALVKERPAQPVVARALVARCYVREDLLLPAEKEARDQTLALRIFMVGREDLLFAAMPVDSELGKWVMGKVPWEHDDRPLLLRVELAFDPAYASIPERVRFVRVVGDNWTR